MADEQANPPYNRPRIIPLGIDWQSLLDRDGDELETQYIHLLRELGNRDGMLGVIFRKAQNKIQDPAKLRRLIVDLIDREQWMSIDADVKGDAYEGLLQKNAEDIKSGAGQYFTPRPLIRAIVDVMKPEPGMRICDPACGTGGFFVISYEYISGRGPLDPDQRRQLRECAFRGWEIVDSAARLCAMNLVLHGVVGPTAPSPVTVDDALRADPGDRFEMILTNPPFGRKSSMRFVGADGEAEREDLTVVREDFWATTSNKQLNFLQHVKTLLKVGGRAAVVIPDNVLFEGGAGESIRKNLLRNYDVHTLLRLPTGIFYAQGVKANVLFFDARPGAETPWTTELWIYDFRTNQHFTLKEHPLKRSQLDDFVDAYRAADRRQRTEGDRFHKFTYAELMARDKANLDIFWLRDESLEDGGNLPDPEIIAQEIADDLEAALSEISEVVALLAQKEKGPNSSASL